jgi:Astacin (Peptidase family M12A)
MAATVEARPYCVLPEEPVRSLPPDLPEGRTRAILVGSSKWVNGTGLHYWFFDRDDPDNEDQREVVRQSFEAWKQLPIGLEFEEVQDASDSEVRIGFVRGDGSWSYLGRGVLQHGVNERTMNFGWDLTTPYGHTTALHEIGHTLGLPHEHQNPFAGIVWNESRVYEYFAGPPHNWARDQTFYNVLRKLSTAEVEGSTWDPDSVMEYGFPPGLIESPADYRDGIDPPGTLSEVDKEWARKWYPGEQAAPPRALTPFQSVPLSLAPAEQADFVIEPPASRRYQIGTFGTADTLIVLFEEVGGQLRYLSGDDDSGTDLNARLSLKLFRGRRYVLRVRLYWAGASGQTAVMYW